MQNHYLPEIFMKNIITVIISLSLFTANAQDKGIKFQSGLTWTQVKEKAKAENKYIFVDCYTTWCVPCKVMANDIFPQPEVSGFFNEKFINVALQFDETNKDGADTKRWREDVKKIKKEYNINAYPTYLFFTPEGVMVHTIIGGSDAKTFMAKSSEALDPKTQLLTLKKQYSAGDRSPEFLKVFIESLGRSWDDQVTEVINVYLPTQKNLLTTENLQLIARATQKSTDPGFKIVQQHAKEFDAVNGPGRSRGLIGDIAFDELVLPIVRKKGTKVIRGGMYFYTGELNNNVDWIAVKTKVETTYPDLADEILLKSKIRYSRDLKDWTKYTEEAVDFATKYEDIVHADQVNTYANDIFLFTADKKCLDQAITMTRKLLAIGGTNNDAYLMTYANLLYKTDKKEEALAITTEAINRLGERAYGFKELQEKIHKNLPTW